MVLVRTRSSVPAFESRPLGVDRRGLTSTSIDPTTPCILVVVDNVAAGQIQYFPNCLYQFPQENGDGEEEHTHSFLVGIEVTSWKELRAHVTVGPEHHPFTIV